MSGSHPALHDPTQAAGPGPDRYAVELSTTKGLIVVDVDRSLAPLGADRFYNLVSIGYYDNVAFFRVIANFMAQVGIHGDPVINKIWRGARIKDDPVVGQNTPGTVSFATSGRDARTTQFFINFRDNRQLDGMGFSPFGKVRDMAAANAVYDGYGEGAPSGQGPVQGRVHREGNAYLKAEFPNLDYIQTARVIT